MASEKWMWITFTILFICVGAHGMVDSYMKNTCRIYYLESNRPVNEISEICR